MKKSINLCRTAEKYVECYCENECRRLLDELVTAYQLRQHSGEA